MEECVNKTSASNGNSRKQNGMKKEQTVI